MVHVTLLLSAFIASIKKKTKASIVLAFTILILFAALRYNFGNDYRSYLNNDILIRSGETPLLKDWLFVSLERICPSFYVFIAITSLISIIPVYYLIKDFVVPEYRYMAFIIYCINPYLFLILFLYFLIHIQLFSFSFQSSSFTHTEAQRLHL